MNPIRIHPVTAGLALVGVALFSVARGQQPQHVQPLTPEQREILGHMSIVYLDDGQGGQAKTIRFTGVNVQVVNGLGATNGLPADPEELDPLNTVTNGLGNMIIGYNELGNPTGDDRTGSHNLIVGIRGNVTSFGGMAIGHSNRSTGPYASVSGGINNTASGRFSAISGGASGNAGGLAAAISGGNAGNAAGQTSSIVGGQLNTALGLRSTVLGGGSNQARAEESVVVGGGHAFNQSEGNVCDGVRSVIVGGSANHTLGGAHTSVVGGGFGRTTADNYDWAAGVLFQDQ